MVSQKNIDCWCHSDHKNKETKFKHLKTKYEDSINAAQTIVLSLRIKKATIIHCFLVG